MEPEFGQMYSNGEIHEMFGGQLRDYLRTKDGRVVCGCFKLDVNPEAPDEVLFGQGWEDSRIIRHAQMIYEQGHAIPIFIFRPDQKPTPWEYVGRWRCTFFSQDKKLIREKMQQYPERDPLNGVLRFECVDAVPASAIA